MYIITRESFETGKEEVLLKDGSWTGEDSGKFMHFIDWTSAMYHLIFMERDHERYDHRTRELAHVLWDIYDIDKWKHRRS